MKSQPCLVAVSLALFFFFCAGSASADSIEITSGTHVIHRDGGYRQLMNIAGADFSLESSS
jgi:hypothetical protein